MSRAMTEISRAITAPYSEAHGRSAGVFLRSMVIGLTAFLTVVDLFATQAILPSLARHYDVAPGAIGFAVNACTLGMAISGLAVGYFSREIDRRKGIWISLALLAIPTALLASAPDLTVFTILRVLQGLCMASAFTLTLAYLGEHYSAADSASAFAAYITGNVASNLMDGSSLPALPTISGSPRTSTSSPRSTCSAPSLSILPWRRRRP
jgi:MFS transporter, YNFM family, putative membrane transport protein